jgi:hypothetical protein
MNTMKLQILCAAILATLAAAGASHWWSVRQFVIAFQQNGISLPSAPADNPTSRQVHARPAASQATLLTKHTAKTKATPDSAQKEFYEQLLTQMQGLQNQNRDLLDQLAETNRDIMKLEFRVDTHSESFRPLPVTEEFSAMSDITDVSPGVLPPKAQRVEEDLPIFE